MTTVSKINDKFYINFTDPSTGDTHTTEVTELDPNNPADDVDVVDDDHDGLPRRLWRRHTLPRSGLEIRGARVGRRRYRAARHRAPVCRDLRRGAPHLVMGRVADDGFGA